MNQIPNRSRLRALEIFLTPGFLLGLALLLVNDFYLKQAYGNFLTGKLSDFSGLFVFSLFLSALCPDRLKLVHVASAVAFVWWKSPLANGMIAAWNSIGIISVARTIDYSDCVALTVLPLSYLYFMIFRNTPGARSAGLRRGGAYLVLVIALFAFGATSDSTDRSVTLPEIYNVRESRVEVERILLKQGRIKDLIPQVTETSFINGTNVKLDRPLYHFDFKLEEKTCDSPQTRMSFLITDHDNYTELAAITMKFSCGDYRSRANFNGLDKSYLERSRELFSREILSKLTPVEPND